VLWLLPVPTATKTGLIQKAVHYAFRLFLWFVETCKGMEFRFEGADLLEHPGAGLIIANHPTLLDVVVLISRLPQADCIVKRELWNHVFLGAIVRSAGYISNDDGPELTEAAMRRLEAGRKVIIFPEGTRSLPEGLRPFTKGFAHIAVRSHCLLWPVVMTCRPSALTKGMSVFAVPARRARLSAVVSSPVRAEDYYEGQDPVPVAVRKVAAALQRYFEEKAVYA